jgi:hypothetical protein
MEYYNHFIRSCNKLLDSIMKRGDSLAVRGNKFVRGKPTLFEGGKR